MTLPNRASWIRLLALAFSVAILPASAGAQVIDPEAKILKDGYQSKKVGDDGVTPFYTFTERATAARVSAVEQSIIRLPKDARIAGACEQMRGSAKALLIQQSGKAYDVAVANYGYSGSTIACVLKFMLGNKVGTQLAFLKQGKAGLYMVFVTD